MASLMAASTTVGMEVVNVPPLPLMSDTEDAVLEESSELDDPETLDLGSHGLTKLSRAAPGYDLTTLTLLLDNNSLQRLDNIHTYQCLEKVLKASAATAECNAHVISLMYVCGNAGVLSGLEGCYAPWEPPTTAFSFEPIMHAMACYIVHEACMRLSLFFCLDLYLYELYVLLLLLLEYLNISMFLFF